MTLLPIYVDEVIKTALKEDINYIDSTVDLLLSEGISDAYFVAKADGVLSGLEVAARVFSLLDSDMQVDILYSDGQEIHTGDVIARFHGSTAAMLKGERTALNILQHMCGIATYTAKCVKAVEGTNASVSDTRKTLPGLRPLQKYSVLMGGGRNHRYNLTDAAMIKDNHIDAYGSITAVVEALREKAGHMLKIEVEVRNLAELEEALSVNADVIMLDNMSLEEMSKAVELTDGRAKLEASGNVTLDNIREIAETGVDIISLGALTHSVTALDISMKWANAQI
ncbi:MAG: carboxylating nicotinate-nucleotide diphosphorylase [Eubacterium sp.]|nr:carboxylating nicotinate-nucleotide diphosphorylase [Eubacterium sp.]